MTIHQDDVAEATDEKRGSAKRPEQDGHSAVSKTDAIDGRIPCEFQVDGQCELLDAASKKNTVTFELGGVKFRAWVNGRYKNTGTLVVSSKQMFRAVAKRFQEPRKW